MSDMPDPPRRGPVFIEDLPEHDVTPSTAPPVPDASGVAMVRATKVAARRRSWFSRIFWAALTSLVLIMIGDAAWSFAMDLIARNVILGRIVIGLIAVVALGIVLAVARELIGLVRLGRVDALRTQAERAKLSADRAEALKVTASLSSLYAGRAELAQAQANMKRGAEEVLDADALLSMAERAYLTSLDAAARVEIEVAARTVAGVTALLPLALADVATALTANLRMIRRIAEIYGGRAGLLGSWRLFKTVAAHLIATGAVAVGDDMIGAVAGGGLLSKLSRRFGEGVVNGALTARVGVAAMDVCRPLPFEALRKPSVTNILQRAMTGMIPSRKE